MFYWNILISCSNTVKHWLNKCVVLRRGYMQLFWGCTCKTFKAILWSCISFPFFLPKVSVGGQNSSHALKLWWTEQIPHPVPISWAFSEVWLPWVSFTHWPVSICSLPFINSSQILTCWWAAQHHQDSPLCVFNTEVHFVSFEILIGFLRGENICLG